MGRDANDILQEDGPDAVAEMLTKAKPYKARGRAKPNGHANDAHTQVPPNDAIDAALDESEGIARLAFVRFWDIKLNLEPHFLVDGIIPREGLTVVFGPAKSGKSFWLFDLMMHVALGWPYRGHNVEKGYVIYCYLEGQGQFAARKEAFVQHHGLKEGIDIDFILMPVPMTLVDDYEALVAGITEMGIRPAAVVIDTLNRSFSGSESSDTDMTAYVKALDAVKASFACATAVVHHCGHEGTRPRGHTSLLGALNALIAVMREAEGKPVVMEVQLLKDGLAGTKLISSLQVIEVGVNTRGKPITSCVVVPHDEPEQPKRSVGRPRGSPANGVGLRALQMAIDELGQPPHGSTHMPQGPNARVVTMDQWTTYAVKLGAVNPELSDKAKSTALGRIKNALHAEGLVGIWGEFAWTTR